MLTRFCPGCTSAQASYTLQGTGSDVVHSSYGEQFSFQVITKTERVTFSGNDCVLVGAFFEAFGLREIKKEVHGEITHVLYSHQLISCFIADLIYRMNRLPQDEAGLPTYDPAKLLMKYQDRKQPSVVTRTIVDAIAGELLSKKVLYVVGVGDEESLVRLWRRYGGTK